MFNKAILFRSQRNQKRKKIKNFVKPTRGKVKENNYNYFFQIIFFAAGDYLRGLNFYGLIKLQKKSV